MNPTTPTGGPAFPQSSLEEHPGFTRPILVTTHGMDVRTWLAGQALAAIANNSRLDPQQIARHAVNLADATLERLRKTP